MTDHDDPSTWTGVRADAIRVLESNTRYLAHDKPAGYSGLQAAVDLLHRKGLLRDDNHNRIVAASRTETAVRNAGDQHTARVRQIADGVIGLAEKVTALRAAKTTRAGEKLRLDLATARRMLDRETDRYAREVHDLREAPGA